MTFGMVFNMYPSVSNREFCKLVKKQSRIMEEFWPSHFLMKTIREKNLKNADEINDIKTLRVARGRHRLRDQSSVMPRSMFKLATGLLQMESSTTTRTCHLHPDIWKHLPTTRLQPREPTAFQSSHVDEFRRFQGHLRTIFRRDEPWPTLAAWTTLHTTLHCRTFEWILMFCLELVIVVL